MLQKFCFTIIIRKVFGNFSRLLFVDNISFNETFSKIIEIYNVSKFIIFLFVFIIVMFILKIY